MTERLRKCAQDFKALCAHPATDGGPGSGRKGHTTPGALGGYSKEGYHLPPKEGAAQTALAAAAKKHREKMAAAGTPLSERKADPDREPLGSTSPYSKVAKSAKVANRWTQPPTNKPR